MSLFNIIGFLSPLRNKTLHCLYRVKCRPRIITQNSLVLLPEVSFPKFLGFASYRDYRDTVIARLLEWRPGAFNLPPTMSDALKKPASIDVARAPMESPPGIAALFLIRFDIRTG